METEKEFLERLSRLQEADNFRNIFYDLIEERIKLLGELNDGS